MTDASLAQLVSERDEAQRTVLALQHARRTDRHEAFDSVAKACGYGGKDWAEMVAVIATLVTERDKLRETVDATVEQWDEWMAERDRVALELDRYGLPREAKVAGLLRHIYNNRDAAHGAAMLAIDGWQERAVAAEAHIEALDDPSDCRCVSGHHTCGKPNWQEGDECACSLWYVGPQGCLGCDLPPDECVCDETPPANGEQK